MGVNMQTSENWYFIAINLLIFLLGDVHLCKSATLEQTNSAELSGPSEAEVTYHWLHSAELRVSRGGCNGCSEYTT